MPAAWFRHTTGSPLAYMASDILTWLAARRGEQLNTVAAWRLCLAREFGQEVTNPNEVRKLVHLYARTVGPVVGHLRFTRTGFEAYTAPLLSAN